ncbi:MAG TPA: glycosyltransferase family 39 protein [Polyangiaceae bacterium]
MTRRAVAEPLSRDTWAITLAALVSRLAVVAWAASRFPPAGDGQYYDIVARRIAQGLGYTWSWPDGSVTYAAHYPVGYPGLLGILYAIGGPNPVSAMLVNALAGTFIVLSVHRVAVRFASRKIALTAALVALLHPTLLFYVPAMMTELVSAALLIGATALAVSQPRTRARFWLTTVAIGGVLGGATLVRPQQILFAPLIGALAAYFAWPSFEPSERRDSRRVKRILGSATLVTSLCVCVCLPWTVRNCNRMGSCALVSVNAGWNLLIGTSSKGNGAWTSVDSVGVPAACRLVFAEAAKDACFGRAARDQILHQPLAWVRLMPAKLERTFDDIGAPGWYLNASDWHHFDERAKFALGVAEVLYQRLATIATLIGLARVRGRGVCFRRCIVIAAILCQLYTTAWLGILLACLGTFSLGRRLLDEPLLMLFAVAYGSTALVHCTFFGGARYAIVVIPYMVVATTRAWSSGQREPLIEVAH